MLNKNLDIEEQSINYLQVNSHEVTRDESVSQNNLSRFQRLDVSDLTRNDESPLIKPSTKNFSFNLSQIDDNYSLENPSHNTSNFLLERNGSISGENKLPEKDGLAFKERVLKIESDLEEEQSSHRNVPNKSETPSFSQGMKMRDFISRKNRFVSQGELKLDSMVVSKTDIIQVNSRINSRNIAKDSQIISHQIEEFIDLANEGQESYKVTPVELESHGEAKIESLTKIKNDLSSKTIKENRAISVCTTRKVMKHSIGK
mgnify:CR=1 FL=1